MSLNGGFFWLNTLNLVRELFVNLLNKCRDNEMDTAYQIEAKNETGKSEVKFALTSLAIITDRCDCDTFVLRRAFLLLENSS